MKEVFRKNLVSFLKQKKKTIFGVGIVCGILLIGWVFLAPKKAAVQYTTAKALKGTLITTVSASGSVSVANKASVTTQASGVIAEVDVKNDDTVSAGETIATVTLDQNGQQKQAATWANYLSAQNSLNTAQAKMNSLQAALFVANQNFVNDKGISNPSDDQKAEPKYIEENATWLQAEADYKNQTGIIAAASSSLSSAWLSYQAVSSTITAPISGKITDLTLTPGMQIAGSSSNATTTTTDSGQAIASIKTDGTPVASISIAEVDVTKVKVGDKTTMTFDALPNVTFTGKIIGINTTGSVSSGVTTYPATVALDTSSEQILPNMSVTASIITNIEDNVLLVPSAAVTTGANGTTVRVMKNGQVTLVPVTAGDSSDSETVIISGISEGETVVTSVIAPSTTSANTSSPFSAVGGRGGFGGGNAVFIRGGGGGAAAGGR